MLNKIILLVCFMGGGLLSGCGYTMGSIAHPQIKTIGIAPVVNETYYPDLSSDMRQSLSERFQFDGSYRVVSVQTADVVLYSRVKKVEITAADITSDNQGQFYRPQRWSLQVTLSYVLVKPGRKKPIVSGEVTGSASYSVIVDQFVSRQDGFIQACRDAAQQTVWAATENW